MRGILRGRIVIENAGKITADGGVIVDNGRIVDIGTFDQVHKEAGSLPVRDYDGIICPGLINAHTHLELSNFKRLRHEDFVDWVMKLVDARSTVVPEETIKECGDAKKRAESQGTSFFVNVGNSLDVNNSLGTNQLFQYEQIGINSTSADTVFDHAAQNLALSKVDSALAIHAPYSVSPELMRKIKSYNNSSGHITSIHLAETPEELEFVRTGKGRMTDLLNKRVGKWSFTPAGVTPIEYVNSLGILDERTICVHCVFTDNDDINILRDRECAVSVCIRSNRELSGQLPPVAKLVKNGVRLLIGTDSTASSPSINMFEEVAAFFSEFGNVAEPSEILAMATSDAARFLGIESAYGSLKPGSRSSVVFLPFDGYESEAIEFVLSEGYKNSGMICD